MVKVRSVYSGRARRLALAMDNDNRVWCAAVRTSNGGSRLELLPMRGGRFLTKDKKHIVSSSSLIGDVALACDGKGKLCIIWNEYCPGKGVQLHFCSLTDDGSSTGPKSVCTMAGSALAPAVTTDRSGRIWCAFGSNGVGKQHIFVCWHEGGQWSAPLRISDGDGHCFAPALCVFGDGVRVVWDSCVDGRFGIYMRDVSVEPVVKLHYPQVVVTEGEEFVANATIIKLNDDSSLIVWERGQRGWGRRNFVPRNPLKKMLSENVLGARRRLAAAIVGPEGVAPLKQDLDKALGSLAGQAGRLQPIAARDGMGRVYLAWQQLYEDERQDGRQAFRQFVSVFEGGCWQRPAEMPDSGATGDSPAVLVPVGQDEMLAAYVQNVAGRRRAHVASIVCKSSSSARPQPISPAGPFKAQCVWRVLPRQAAGTGAAWTQTINRPSCCGATCTATAQLRPVGWGWMAPVRMPIATRWRLRIWTFWP